MCRSAEVRRVDARRSRHDLVLTTTFDTKARRHKGQKQEKPTTIAWVIGRGSPFDCLCFSLQFAFVPSCQKVRAKMRSCRVDARRGFRPWLRRGLCAARFSPPSAGAMHYPQLFCSRALSSAGRGKGSQMQSKLDYLDLNPLNTSTLHSRRYRCG